MSKLRSLAEAIAAVPDGSSIMVGGFGSPGTPFSLIDELIRQGKRDLVIIKNDANQDGYGVSRLVQAGAVRKLITTHVGLSGTVQKAFNARTLEIEFASQGLFAERIRCAGVGLPAFLTDIELPVELCRDRTVVEYRGQQLFVEPALKADFALITGHVADSQGNLRHHGAALNFTTLMAMAADCVVAEIYEMRPTALPPNDIHTAGIFVHRLVPVKRKSSHEYEAIQR